MYFFNVFLGASLVAQRLKRLPAMQEIWVRSLGREDPLEKATVHRVAKSQTRLSNFTSLPMSLLYFEK